MTQSKKLFTNLLEQNLFFDYERRMSFQKVRLFDQALQKDIPELLGVDMGQQAYRIKSGVITHWCDQKGIETLHTKATDFFRDQRSEGKIYELIDYINTSLEELARYSEDIPSYATLSNEELRDEYGAFCAIERKTSFMNQLLYEYFEHAITEALYSMLGKSDRDRVIAELSKQTEFTPLDAYYHDLCSHLIKGSGLDDLYDKYISFGSFDVLDHFKSKDDIDRDAQELKKKGARETRETINQKYQKQIEINDKIMKAIRLNPQMEALTSYYTMYSNKKEWKNFVRGRSSYKLSQLLAEIGKRANLTLREIAYLTESEIIDTLFAKGVDRDKLRQRQRNSLYLIYKDKTEVVDEAEFLERFDKAVSCERSALTGDVAYAGTAVGKVCVLLSNEDFSKFQKDDVVVSPTTRPDFVPLLQDSVAVITNEGGLLSHAAIVAREMKKPCIIGTKNATQVLKDGMMVEVDAERGVVTILEEKDK